MRYGRKFQIRAASHAAAGQARPNATPSAIMNIPFGPTATESLSEACVISATAAIGAAMHARTALLSAQVQAPRSVNCFTTFPASAYRR